MLNTTCPPWLLIKARDIPLLFRQRSGSPDSPQNAKGKPPRLAFWCGSSSVTKWLFLCAAELTGILHCTGCTREQQEVAAGEFKGHLVRLGPGIGCAGRGRAGAELRMRGAQRRPRAAPPSAGARALRGRAGPGQRGRLPSLPHICRARAFLLSLLF